MTKTHFKTWRNTWEYQEYLRNTWMLECTILGVRGRSRPRLTFINQAYTGVSMQTYSELKRAMGDRHQCGSGCFKKSHGLKHLMMTLLTICSFIKYTFMLTCRYFVKSTIMLTFCSFVKSTFMLTLCFYQIHFYAYILFFCQIQFYAYILLLYQIHLYAYILPLYHIHSYQWLPFITIFTCTVYFITFCEKQHYLCAFDQCMNSVYEYFSNVHLLISVQDLKLLGLGNAAWSECSRSLWGTFWRHKT